jgi:uncharacterized protein (DUF779 family)
MKTGAQTINANENIRSSTGSTVLFCPINGNLLLFEIPPVFFINQNQIMVIVHTELVVDISVGRGQIVGTQE